jgi:hypothetical protein
MAVITDEGRSAFWAVPFDDAMVQHRRFSPELLADALALTGESP